MLFVDADNHLPPDYLAAGLACFDSPQVAVVYSDLQRFGIETGRTAFPSHFDDHLFARNNFVDTNSIIRRSALEVVDVWDRAGLAPMPEDYYTFRKLREAGFGFRKQPSVVNYRTHVRQTKRLFCTERSWAGYFEATGIKHQTVTLFLPLSGRLDCWRQMSSFLDGQSWPHDQIRLICCDTSQHPTYAREVRRWLLDSTYPDISYFALAAGTAGLVNEDRRNADVEAETNLVMCRIYNQLRRRVTTDYVWVLEDDVIPRQPDQLERMLRHFRGDVATVTLLEPVVMQPLRREWADVKAKCEKLTAELGERVPTRVAGVLRLHWVRVPAELLFDRQEPDYPGHSLPRFALGVAEERQATSHLDRLAAQGLKLTNFHNCQNCTPTRAALMSGQYGPRTGVCTVGGIGRFDWSMRPLRPVDNVTDLPLDRDIIARQLKAAGYATGMFGKWHIGERGEYHPGQRGFDEAIVSGGVHFDFATNPKTAYPQGQYLADFLTDRAVDFITRHKDEPFFLYLPHFAVHSPHQAKPELIEKFQAKPGVGGHNNPTYAAMIYSVDQSVGRVMQTLDELKLAENTVLIFTSDNGGVGGYVREGIKASGDVTDNAPLRSGKGSLYEGGTREPFIVRWPGVTPPGSTCDVPTIHVDIFPTFLELAGAPDPRQVLDGESLVKLFRDPAAALQRDAIFQHFPGYLGAGQDAWRTTPVSLIQCGDWKLMEFLEDGRLELYNLREDIGETRNLATEMPDKARELQARLVAWRSAVSAPMPTRNDGSPPPPKNKQRQKDGRRKAQAG